MQLISHFERSARLHPSRAAFIQPDGTMISYCDALRWIETTAALLASSGLPSGATVAIYSPNDARGLLAMLAVVRAGYPWASLNARNTVEDNVAFATTADARALLYHSKFEEETAQIAAVCPAIGLRYCLDRVTALAPFLDEAAAAHTAAPPELPHDNARPCTIFATGGTTGRSKGAVWTNQTWETLTANYWTSAPRCDHPVHLCVAPMTHGAGALALMLLPHAPTNVVMTSADPGDILRVIAAHRVTHMFLPPTVLYALLSSPELGRHDTSSLQFFLISAAPVSPDRLREAVAAFGPVMHQSFGQAEAPFFLTHLSPSDLQRGIDDPAQARLLQSCGKATMFSDVAIMDEDGSLLPPGQPGEIVARGNLVMAGYFRDPEGTATVSEHGWHHTGDIGVRDEYGYFYIVDRKRDMIITGGFNVYTTEVEAAMLTHPAVLNCAVVGVPDAKWGEAVKGVVELKDGAEAVPEELIAHCKALLGGVKCPKTVEIWDALPRSPVGKVLKRAIRERYWSGQERAV
ncbi:AMP-binding protein [Novosphingobium sp.]|uniref:AMP-binding protein n=1 Tax=Novosphingobium sp. TaxID=1874826 RepID=UPI0038BAC87B